MSKSRGRYEVVVGNIGTVYSGGSRKEADRKFAYYKEASISGSVGRATGEDVTMFCNDEICKEYVGAINRDRTDWD